MPTKVEMTATALRGEAPTSSLTSPLSSSALRRLDGLQVGRAVAACGVAIAHAVTHFYGGGFGIWAMIGQFGVILFFVISGFIMVLTTGRGSFRPADFLSRRVRRVVPIYYVAILVLAIGTLVVPTAFARTAFDVPYIISSLLFLPTYDPSGSGQIVPFFKLGWTLNYEMFFYVLFAALFALNAWQRAFVLVSILSALIVAGWLFDFHSAALVFYTRIATLAFAFGSLLGVFTLYNPEKVLRASSTHIMAAAAICVVILLWLFRDDYDVIRDNPSTTFLLSIAATLTVFFLVSFIDGRTITLHPVILYLGDASYSIYLFHMFAVGVMTAVAHRLPDYLIYPALALSGLISILTGVVAYWLIESRFNQWFRFRRPLTAAQITEAPNCEIGK